MADQNISIVVQLRDQASAALRSLADRVSSSAAQMNSASKSAAGGMNELNKSMAALGPAGNTGAVGVATITKGILGAQAIVAGAQLAFEGLRAAISQTSQFEQYRIGFETMTGSAEIARETLKELTDFAIATPFETGQVVEMSQRLMAMGVETDKLTETMKILGDTASVTGMEKLPNLTLAYGQVKTAGRLTGMELRQFTEAGVPMIDMLAKQMGRTGGEIKKMVEDGQVGFRNVEQALLDFTSKGGRGFNAMENQSKSLSGLMAQLRDNVKVAAMEILGMAKTGDIVKGSFFDRIKNAANDALNFFNQYRGVFVGVGKILINSIIFVAEVIATAFKAVAKVLSWIGGVFASVFNSIAGSQKSFGEWVVSAWNTVLEAIAGIFSWIGKQAVSLVDLMNNLPGVDIDTSGITAAVGRINGALGGMKVNLAEWRAASNTTAEDIKLDFSGMGLAAKDAGDTASKANKKAADDAKKAAEEHTKAIESVEGKYSDLQTKISDSLSKISADHAKTVADITEKVAEMNSKIGGEKMGIAEKYVEQQQKVADLETQVAEKRAKLATEQKDSTQQLIDLKEKLRVLEMKQGEQTDKTSASSKQSLADQIVDAKRKISEVSAGGTADKDLAELEDKLARERAALTSAAEFEKTLSAEITEAKRRAALTDFQRFVDDSQKKITQYQTDITELQKKLTIENTLYEEQEAKLQKLRLLAATRYEAYMSNMTSVTKASADKMVSEMQRIIDMQSRITGAKSATDLTNATNPAGDQAKVAGFATGGIVPGFSFGDVVPAMLEPQEEVVTRSNRNSLVNSVNSLLGAINAGMMKPQVNQNITQYIGGNQSLRSAAEEQFFAARTARFF